MIKIGDKVEVSESLARLLGTEIGKSYTVGAVRDSTLGIQVNLEEYPRSGWVHHSHIVPANEPFHTVTFKPGDKVKRKDGELFSNGSLVVTVDKISCNNHIWFKETKTWSHFDYLTLVSVDDDKIEPFRTVTKRELKPGRYGRVRISDSFQIRVEAVTDVEQLDEVMHTLAQIREVLSDD